jgi:hypothetical protein
MPKQVKTSKMKKRRGENRLEGKGKKKPEKGVCRLYLYIISIKYSYVKGSV